MVPERQISGEHSKFFDLANWDLRWFVTSGQILLSFSKINRLMAMSFARIRFMHLHLFVPITSNLGFEGHKYEVNE